MCIIIFEALRHQYCICCMLTDSCRLSCINNAAVAILERENQSSQTALLCNAEALCHALQQQTSFAQSGCTVHLLPKCQLASSPVGLMTTPQGQAGMGPGAGAGAPGHGGTDPAPAGGLAGTSPEAAAASQGQARTTPASAEGRVVTSPEAAAAASGQAGASHIVALPQAPSLVLSSRGAVLLVVSVQLKTGYLKAASGEALAEDQTVKQLVSEVSPRKHTSYTHMWPVEVLTTVSQAACTPDTRTSMHFLLKHHLSFCMVTEAC